MVQETRAKNRPAVLPGRPRSRWESGGYLRFESVGAVTVASSAKATGSGDENTGIEALARAAAANPA